MKTVTWILRIAVALAFFTSANMKLASFAEAANQFESWGYPVWWLYMVATIEFLGAIGLLIPRLVQTAASVLVVLMLGAVYTSFMFGDSLVSALPAIILLALLSFIILLERGAQTTISL